MVNSLNYDQITLDHPQTALMELKRNDSLLTYLLKTFNDHRSVKGTFLCQFVASDGLIGLCKAYNNVKSICIGL
jgi:hypothetical protein